MRYIYDYLYLSLVFLGVISYRYFSQKQFPSLRNRVFSAILITAFIDLFLDILSSVVIENVLRTPVWLTYIVCYSFYAVQSVFPFLLLAYILTLAGQRRWLRPPGLFAAIAPCLIALVLLFSNLFTRRVFYVDPELGYVHAPQFILLYINTAAYIALCVTAVHVYSDEILPIERRTILIFIVILTTMIGVQYLLPRYLLSGASIAVALTLMYVVMQKPEDMIDAVSGAFNHDALMLFAQSKISERKPFSLILLDLLYMRRINRLFGVKFGSKTLNTVMREMKAAACGGWVFRSVGNLFVLANADPESHARAYAELCRRIDHEIDIAGISMQLTATIVSLPDISAIRTVEDLNECMESAINTVPRGEHRELPVEMLLGDQRREAVEDALMHAVKDESITAVLQPIYSLKENRFVSAEALARFRHETLGNIPPGEFIPIAEKNGWILPLDRQIIRKVCRFLKESEANLTAVEINLSPVEFVNEQLCTRIIETVREYGVSPSKIWFEITETSTNVDPKLLNSYMNRLYAEGFRFALDDYGIGYSNISRIMNLPFSMVKLDRSMLLGSMEDPRQALIMKSTVQMLHDLNLSTLVEGVETREQEEAMRKLGVDFIQGFYYARPMPMEDIAGFLRSRSESGSAGKAAL